MPLTPRRSRRSRRSSGSRGSRRRFGRRTVAVALGIGVSALIGTSGLGLATSTSAYASGPSIKVTPTSGLHSGQTVTITVKGEPPGATLLALECSPQALTIGEDGCENRQNAVFFGTKAAEVTRKFGVLATISTAAGRVTCGTSKCLIAVVQLTPGNGDSVVGAAGISFASPSGTAASGQGPPAPGAWKSPSGLPSGTAISAGHADHLNLEAGLAPDLSSPVAVTGPSVTLAAIAPPSTRHTGAALVQLVLAAPKTSWAYRSHTAVVVDVTVGTGPTQQIVCFAGSRAFTYAAVFGTTATGAVPVTVAVDRTLSTTGGLAPSVILYAARISIVTRANPAYLAMAYAPVVYGRPSTAKSDTPLLTYATSVPSPPSDGPAGTMTVTYTTIWSKEDAGTSFVPWLEWGEWGRMTDITETTSVEVTPTGTILHPMYDSCGCPKNYPVERTSPVEQEVAFNGKHYESHLIVRNASGNDYQSDTGTTAFRMVQAPVAGPVPGAARETVMDARPWTYRVAAEELSRWYSDGTTSPASAQIGSTNQYAIVDISTVAKGTSAVGVAIRLKGSSTWYSDDFGSGYTLYTGGHGRTAVKLPLGWATTGIAAVRVVGYPSSSAAWSVRHVRVRILGLTNAFAITRPSFPTPVVVKG